MHTLFLIIWNCYTRRFKIILNIVFNTSLDIDTRRKMIFIIYYYICDVLLLFS